MIIYLKCEQQKHYYLQLLWDNWGTILGYLLTTTLYFYSLFFLASSYLIWRGFRTVFTSCLRYTAYYGWVGVCYYGFFCPMFMKFLQLDLLSGLIFFSSLTLKFSWLRMCRCWCDLDRLSPFLLRLLLFEEWLMLEEGTLVRGSCILLLGCV